MNPTTEHTEHPETATATKQPGGHPILIALAVLAVVAASVAFLLLRAPLLRMASDLMPDWKTGPGTPGDWALLVPGGVVVGIAASIVVLLAVASLLKTGAFALGLAIFFLVAAPCFFFYASASVGMATLDRYGLAISAASTQTSDADGRVEIPFYYEWSVPLTSEEMKNALKPVVGKIAGLDRLVTFTEHYRPPRADFVIVFSQTGNAEGNEFRETVEMLYAALDEVAVPEGAVLRVPLSVKGVKTPGTSSATQSPAASESHAETAESAEPRPGEAGPLPEGAAERSEAGGVSRAESAEWRPTPEQTGRFRFDDKGKVVIAEVDAEGRVRLLENGPDSPPLRIRPATIRNRNLFVVEMDDIPDTGRHWTLALDFDAAKRAWIVVGEGETAADIVPEKPGYRTALFRRLDEPPSAPVP